MGIGSEDQRVILIAEDENIVAKDIAESLDRLGYRVAGVVTSGREAVEQATRVKPDLVLMDVNLRGDLDGIGAASALRDCDGPPVIFLTAFSDVETLKRAVESEPLGYLVKPFREAELGCVIAVALERRRAEVSLKRREESFRHLSLMDEATGLYNRRGFLELARQAMRVSRRSGSPLALFFVDLDGLKDVNDLFGHAEGDQAIEEAAQVLRRTFREPDLVARVGGDEFVVLALDADAEGAARAEQRLRDNLVRLNSDPARKYSLELSVGCALHDREANETVETLLERADTQMYLSKRERRSSSRTSSA
jgi:two-component system cell cycle response regulator